jgi:hypothetical protein
VGSGFSLSPVSGRRPFCAEVSSARDEPLGATASRIDHWILIEYRGAWSRDVVGQSLLSPRLKDHLREQLAALPHSRLLFVKKPERRAQSGRRVFFGTSRPGEERFFELEVEHQDELVDFDFTTGGAPAIPLEGPLFVVCTHGKRDRCCARYGRPLYDALRRVTESDSIWQSTHVGGDRFAGNVVVLPQGVYYGRVDEAGAEAVVAAHAAGRVDLERYRGRSAFSFAVQAAELAIRESQDLVGIDDLPFLGATRPSPGETRARFRAPDGAVHEVDVRATLAEEAVYLTCESAEPKRARRCEVTAHRVVSR